MARSKRRGKNVSVDWDARLKALNHPSRRVVLRWLHTKGAADSPSRVGERFEVPLSRLSYHFTCLRLGDLIALESEKARRGAMEHLYASQVADDPIVLSLLEETRAGDEEWLAAKQMSKAKQRTTKGKSQAKGKSKAKGKGNAKAKSQAKGKGQGRGKRSR